MKRETTLARRPKMKPTQEPVPRTETGMGARLGADGLPERGVLPDFPEGERPPITQHEILEYDCARDSLITAKLDFERKRAQMLYKLRLCCPVEEGRYSLKVLNKDEETVLIVGRLHADGPTVKTDSMTRGF
jgi:hypothetical protein